MTPMPQQVGRYRILSEVGRGAMGVVYRAHDPQLDRQVAVKLISVSMAGGTSYGDEELEGRFLREARVAARLQHPNVVAVYDAGREGRDLFLVMELIEGESLADRLSRGPQPTVLEALEMIAQAADALGAAHSANVIHRDVKPANLLITREGRVKVSDFGVAKAIGEGTELTRTGTMVGSPAYMAPEQIRGQQLDGRSDLFSLGVVLYEMLLRRKPFPADTVTSLVYQILHEDPLADPGVSTGQLGPDLTALLRWCLAKKPEDRIPDARTFSTRARAIVAKASSSAAEAHAPTQMLSTAPIPGSAPTRPAAMQPLAGVGSAAGAVAGSGAAGTSGRAPAVEASTPTAIRPAAPTPPAEAYDLPPTRIVPPPTLPPPPPALPPQRPPAARSETAASYAPATKPAWWWVVAAGVVLIGVGVALATLRRPSPPAIGQSEPPTATVTPEVPSEAPAPRPAAAPFTTPTSQPVPIQTAPTSPPAATMPPLGTPTAQRPPGASTPATTGVMTGDTGPTTTPTAPTAPQPWRPQPIPAPTPTPPPAETAPAAPEPAKDASKEKDKEKGKNKEDDKGKDDEADKEDDKGKDKSSGKDSSGGEVEATFKCREAAKFSFGPDEAHVIVNGHDIGTADDWDDMGGGKTLKLKEPGNYRVELKLKGYRTTWIEIVVDPKAKEKVCDVDTDLEEND